MPEDQELIEQRYAIAEGAVTLYLLGHGAGGVWQVWLNHKHDFDGLLLGHGATRDEALNNSIELLLEGVRALRALNNGSPPASDRPNQAGP